MANRKNAKKVEELVEEVIEEQQAEVDNNDNADNPYVNKVVYGNQTLIDLTADDVARTDVLEGKVFHLPSGEKTTGTCTYDADTKDATANAGEILNGKTAYKNGEKITGTMPNVGGVDGKIAERDQEYSVPAGYHDGSGKVAIDDAEKAKIIAENIKEGVTILGITGTHSGSEDMKPEQLSVTPYTTAKQYLPSEGFNCFSQVDVAAIAYVETDNTAGGKTATIGTVAPE